MNITTILPSTSFICYCLLFSWIADVVTGLPAHLNSSVANLEEALCDYLDKEVEQKNAYTLGSGFCCFCPPGTSFDGDCDPTNPPSTQCKPCPQGTHMHYGPHLETQCYKKRYGRHCPFPKVYFEGSREVADGCKCQDGMYEDNDTGECKYENTVGGETLSTTSTNNPTERPTTVDAIIKPMQTTPSSSPSTTEVTTSQGVTTGLLQWGTPELTSKTAPQLMDSHAITPDTENVIHVDPLPAPLTKATPVGDSGSTWWVPLMGLVSAMGVFTILMLMFLLVYWMKLIPRKSSDVLDSTSQLSDGPTSSTEMMVRRDCLADRRSSQTVSVCHQESEIPLLSRKEPSEIQHSSLNVGCPSNKIMDRDSCIRRAIEEHAAKILERDYEKFAMNVATELGKICRRELVIPIFRTLLGLNHDTVFDDYCRIYSHTRELIYQCMRYAVTCQGVSLTPIYIWEKVRSYGCESYTEIVSDAIKLFANGQSEV